MSLQLGARSSPSEITMAELWVTLFRLKGLLDQGGGWTRETSYKRSFPVVL